MNRRKFPPKRKRSPENIYSNLLEDSSSLCSKPALQMKRLRINNTSTRKTLGTVSAAALMLGVSHAASIGFNFQTDYCGLGGYRNNVTATAFGIPADGWENLTPMMTGFGATLEAGRSHCVQAVARCGSAFNTPARARLEA